jgi:hypothetical protein
MNDEPVLDDDKGKDERQGGVEAKVDSDDMDVVKAEDDHGDAAMDVSGVGRRWNGEVRQVNPYIAALSSIYAYLCLYTKSSLDFNSPTS